MISVTLSSNTNRTTVIVPEDTTVKQVLTDNNMNLGAGTVSLDGIPLTASDMAKTLAELGAKETCFLTVVVKSDNAK